MDKKVLSNVGTPLLQQLSRIAASRLNRFRLDCTIGVDNHLQPIDHNMNIIYKIFMLIAFVGDIQGHGFCNDTAIRSFNCWQRIEQLSWEANHFKTVLSYDFGTQKYVYREVVSIRPGRTNCYIKIGFDDSRSNGIICTPSQEFYLPEYDAWVEACFLRIGDKLLSEKNQHKPIVYVEFIEEPRDIYVMEVEDPHTFFVGSHTVLVKNMILPCVTIGYVFPFGGGAGGGFLGTLLGGTLTGTIECIVGGVAIGYLVKCCMNNREKSYDFIFGTSQLGFLFQDKGEPQADGTIGIPAEISRIPYKTVEDILQSAMPGRKTKGRTKLFEKPGTYEDAERDFDSLGALDIFPIDCGRVGKLSDGRSVIVRNRSEDKRPTLEIQGPGNQIIKIRYGDKYE